MGRAKMLDCSSCEITTIIIPCVCVCVCVRARERARVCASVCACVVVRKQLLCSTWKERSNNASPAIVSLKICERLVRNLLLFWSAMAHFNIDEGAQINQRQALSRNGKTTTTAFQQGHRLTESCHDNIYVRTNRHQKTKTNQQQQQIWNGVDCLRSESNNNKQKNESQLASHATDRHESGHFSGFCKDRASLSLMQLQCPKDTISC